MWTVNETELLKAQHKHGFTVDESAEIIEKSRLDIINKLISLGLKPITEKAKPEQNSIFNEIEETKKERKRRIAITPEIEQRVVQLRKQRFSFSEIAKRVGISQSSASRIVQRQGLPREKRYNKKEEPAPVAAETSPEIKISTVNNTSKSDFMQEQLKKIKSTLETADYSTMAKVGQVIGEAIGRIDTLISIAEGANDETKSK